MVMAVRGAGGPCDIGLEGSTDGLVWADLVRDAFNALPASLPGPYPFYRVRTDIILR